MAVHPGVENWIGEYTNSQGCGDIILAGSFDGFGRFSDIGTNLVYYTIENGLNKETGIGRYNEPILERIEVHSTLENGVYSNGGQPISLLGRSAVYCAINANQYKLVTGMADKLDGIEDGATADQTAIEVPYNNSYTPIESQNVSAALDWLKQHSLDKDNATLGGDLDLGDHRILGHASEAILRTNIIGNAMTTIIGSPGYNTHVYSNDFPGVTVAGQNYTFYTTGNPPDASSVGAYSKSESDNRYRPVTWTPSADDVGALTQAQANTLYKGINWMPTAADVGALTKAQADTFYRSISWLPTADQVGALTKDNADTLYHSISWVPSASDVGALTKGQADGYYVAKTQLATAGGAANAGKVPVLDENGKLPASMGGGAGGGFNLIGGIDATDDAPTNPESGDAWLFDTAGTLNSTWGDDAGGTVKIGDFVFYHDGWHFIRPDLDPSGYVLKTGSTMTGPLKIKTATTHLELLNANASHAYYHEASANGNYSIVESGIGTRMTMSPNGKTAFYYQGRQKLEVNSTGISVGSDAVAAVTVAGSGNNAALISARNTEGGVQLRADDGNAYLYQTDAAGNAGKVWLNVVKDGGVHLNYDGNEKIKTTASGVEVKSASDCAAIIRSENDTPSVLKVMNTEGGSELRADAGNAYLHQLDTNGTPIKNWLKGLKNSGVELNHNGNKKFETTADGTLTAGNHMASGSIGIPYNNNLLFNKDAVGFQYAVLQDGSSGNLKFNGRDGQDSWSTLIEFTRGGNVSAPADPSGANHLTNKKYVDGSLNTKENTLNADQKRKITYGSAAPSGGNSGDVYIQYS